MTFWKLLLTPTNRPKACRTNWACMWCRMLWCRRKMCTATCCSRLPTLGSWSCPRCQAELCTPIWSVDPLPQFLQKPPSSSSHYHLPAFCLSFHTDFRKYLLMNDTFSIDPKKLPMMFINLQKVDIVPPQLLYQVSTLHINVLVQCQCIISPKSGGANDCDSPEDQQYTTYCPPSASTYWVPGICKGRTVCSPHQVYHALRPLNIQSAFAIADPKTFFTRIQVVEIICFAQRVESSTIGPARGSGTKSSTCKQWNYFCQLNYSTEHHYADEI